MDKNIEIAQHQAEIEEYIGLGKNSLIFNYESNENTTLQLITVNPRHNQSFLFHITEGLDKLDALQKMSEYVRSYKDKDSSYTIQWRMQGEKQLHTSYFHAKNILEALDKLFFDRDPNTITVFNVSLNPVA